MSEIQTEDGFRVSGYRRFNTGTSCTCVARQQSQPSGRSKSSSQYATQEEKEHSPLMVNFKKVLSDCTQPVQWVFLFQGGPR